MSAKKTRVRQARDAAGPYVQRLVEDQELRANITDALEAARKAYGRVANGKRPARALMEDRKVHRDLRKTAESLRQASENRSSATSSARASGPGHADRSRV